MAEDGSATVEFAILFPAFITFVIGCCWVGLFAVTVANVQQLTYEVARQTLQYRVAPRDDLDFCQHVGETVVPAIAKSFVAIDPSRITATECVPGNHPGWVQLTLHYDGSGYGFAPLVRAVNNGSDMIVGSAMIVGG
ncbi:TadE family protein [Mameliella sediminis]|uniref:TadE family protein n=1 Tax=Mameliella sediminis TaxID=2836866 RepID=UPI001C47DB1F|nr:TadE family protein [Mameliella sediminis]MBY6114385.1 pilus assembly protein [Antarctobacter heliothermus]MBY6143958.1 pilus assembly protein [Mameliella alba]MBV7393134.1 pilus assembly protein [Mameliella sediminis]MBY6163394.1 pilus assembly protein [Mameliella alba]MBY6171657.1 pilus assembly protein [Mameliella alba]